MTWRRNERKQATTQTERPDLTAVLDYYDVRYDATKTRQMILCPVHEERGPSCSLDLNRELWNCLSCGKAGSAWDLIMEKENCDFRGATAIAADQRFATGGAGGGNGGVPEPASRWGRSVPAREGRRPGGGGYTPSWRRS